MTEWYTDIASDYTVYISADAHNNEEIKDSQNNDKLIYYGNKAEDTNSCLHNYSFSPISLNIVEKPDDSTCSVSGQKIDDTVGKILFTCDANTSNTARTFIIGFSKSADGELDTKLKINQYGKKYYLNFIIVCQTDTYLSDDISTLSGYAKKFVSQKPYLYISLSNKYSSTRVQEFYTLDSLISRIDTDNWKLNNYNGCTITYSWNLPSYINTFCIFNDPISDGTYYYTGGISTISIPRFTSGTPIDTSVVLNSNFSIQLNNEILTEDNYEIKIYYSYTVVQTH